MISLNIPALNRVRNYSVYSKGNPTSQFGEVAYVVSGAGPPILPTKTSDFKERVERIRPTADKLVSGSELLDTSEVRREYTNSRSRAPSLRYAPEVEQHFSYNNDLGRSYYELSPTRGSSVRSHSIQHTTQSGEGHGAPRGRGLTLEPQTPAPGIEVVPRGDNRKGNPDLREFISGFVKYLNGNVPVGQGMPRPVRNRINNRGPPKITDISPIILDPEPPPSLQPPPPPTVHDPPPYPFEKPILPPEKHIVKPFVSGVPLPEQLVPTERPLLLPSSPPSLRPPLRPVRPKPGDKPDNKTKDPTKIYLDQSKDTIKPYEPPKQPIREPVRSFYDVAKETVRPHFESPPREPIQTFLQNSPRPPNPSKDEVATETSKPLVDTTPLIHAVTQAETASSLQPEPTSPTTDLQINATKVLGVEMSSEVNVVTEKIMEPEQMKNSTTETPPSGSNSNATTTTSTTSTAANSTTKMPSTMPNVTTTEATKTNSPTPQIVVGNVTSQGRPVATGESTTDMTAIPSITRVRPALIESSIVEEVPLRDVHQPTKWEQGPGSSKPYKGGFAPRPGIVLDDPEYKPGGGLKTRPIITAPPKGEIFDVTVSAVHGASPSTGQPVIYPVELEGVNVAGAGNGEVSVITKAEEGQHFVSIDGKRTYINLFGSTEQAGVKPTPVTRPQIKTTSGYGAVQQGQVVAGPPPNVQQQQQQRPKRPVHRRPQQPPVRIDTCIVGDWSTCDSDQHEICRTEQGVSSCHCAPGYSRHSHRQPCKRVVSVIASVQIDKIYEHKLTWNDKLRDVDSQEYLQLEYESARAMESAMSMTPFSDAFMGAKLNNIYTMPGASHKPVYVNMTIQIEESAETKRPQIKQEIQKQLLGAIHRRSNNIGTSPLWAVPANSVSALQDLDECRSPELNDCHVAATCQNTFGSFECSCPPGYKDEFASNPQKSGRRCETCSSEHCNHRGTCSYNKGQPVCQCAGNYYGSQCEVDGEVLGVAIGASVAAVIIILSTLACLCMWSRRWNKEQKCAGIGSPVFGYMPSGGSTVKTPGIGAPPYQVSLEDRLRWAQIADAMAQSTNHYAPEPVGMPTRPSSAMFGYGGTMPIAPMPLPRLGLRPGSAHNTTSRQHDSSSDEEDRTDLLGRNFQVPRPKSRSSIANQSGIYYDVDYEQQNDHYGTTKHPGCIALNTYTMGRSHYYRT
ncbi:hypothetical protein GE061_002588 [Apolygus lucorum]|uniref:EGF-like domain-containing protein n=2 Tax=Mirini TaxID=236659 RepID=A0A8S9X7B5_APOLU|nr:hypothetical protein GE061_002588 [Apolygus lucorum]